MKKLFRRITILFVSLVYFFMISSCIFPALMSLPVVAHAVTGECSGDCDVCGCAPERRAGRTCCCRRKKLGHSHEREQAFGCCHVKNKKADKEFVCNCPCGSNKMLDLWGVEKPEHLPQNNSSPSTSLWHNRFPTHACSLTDGHGDPPEFPPKPILSA